MDTLTANMLVVMLAQCSRFFPLIKQVYKTTKVYIVTIVYKT